MGNKGGMRKRGSSSRIALQIELNRRIPADSPLRRAMNSRARKRNALDFLDDTHLEGKELCPEIHPKNGLHCWYPIEDEHDLHAARNPAANNSWVTWSHA